MHCNWSHFFIFILFSFLYQSGTAATVVTRQSQKTVVNTRQKQINTNKYLPNASKLTRAATDRYYETGTVAENPITCVAGQYLPANAQSCSACKDRYYCPGGTFFVKSYDQGIKNAQKIVCSSGKYLPAKSIYCKDCGTRYYCPGGAFYFSLTIDQGRKHIQTTCKSGQYLPANATSCTNCKDRYYCPGGTFFVQSYDQGIGSPNSFFCWPGNYAPKAQKGCSPCRTDNKYICKGGLFEFNTTKDQGLYLCPPGASVDQTKNACTFSQDMLVYGIQGRDSPLAEQCWTRAGSEAYKKCLTSKE